MRLGRLKDLLPNANAIDLGCGADGGVLPYLLQQEGVRPLGVEMDPSGNNENLIAAEIRLRIFQAGFPDGETAKFSCYPFYVRKYHQKPGVRLPEAIEFLKKRGKSKTKLFVPDYEMPADLPVIDPNVASHMVKGDVLRVLAQAQDGQFEQIWLDYLIRNVGEKMEALMAMCRSKLADTGSIYMLHAAPYVEDLNDELHDMGFSVEAVEEVRSDERAISLSRKGLLLMREEFVGNGLRVWSTGEDYKGLEEMMELPSARMIVKKS